MCVIYLKENSSHLPVPVEAAPGEASFIPRAERDGTVRPVVHPAVRPASIAKHPVRGARRDLTGLDRSSREQSETGLDWA